MGLEVGLVLAWGETGGPFEFTAEVAWGGEGEFTGDLGGTSTAFEEVAGVGDPFIHQPLFWGDAEATEEDFVEMSGSATEMVADRIDPVISYGGERGERESLLFVIHDHESKGGDNELHLN